MPELFFEMRVRGFPLEKTVMQAGKRTGRGHVAAGVRALTFAGNHKSNGTTNRRDLGVRRAVVTYWFFPLSLRLATLCRRPLCPTTTRVVVAEVYLAAALPSILLRTVDAL